MQLKATGEQGTQKPADTDDGTVVSRPKGGGGNKGSGGGDLMYGDRRFKFGW